MTGAERFERWTRFVQASHDEIVHAFWNRKVFRSVAAMFESNERLRVSGRHVHQWIGELYATQAAMLVRRELDKRAGVMNLRHLLHEIEQNIGVLAEHSRANGLPTATEVRVDRDTLVAAAEPTRLYAEQLIAHRSPGPEPPTLTFAQVDVALRVVLVTMRKYYGHITATDLLAGTPTPTFDWLSPFTFAWQADGFREPEDDEELE
jgi:hypothetical protein